MGRICDDSHTGYICVRRLIYVDAWWVSLLSRQVQSVSVRGRALRLDNLIWNFLYRSPCASAFLGLAFGRDRQNRTWRKGKFDGDGSYKLLTLGSQ